VSTSAYGGNGGDGGNSANTANGHGGAGGNATASASGSNAGIGLATFSASAYGGVGGRANGVGFNAGVGGDASAVSSGSGANGIGVNATARGGQTPGVAADGSAYAYASGAGASGFANTEAISGGGATTFVAAVGAAPIDGTSVGEARAAASKPFPSASLANGLQTAAYAMGMPNAGDVTAAVPGNPHAAAMVGSGANVLGMMLLRGEYSDNASGASQTYVSTAAFTVDLTQLPSLHDLQLAALDATITDSGFDSLRLEVFRESVAVIDNTYTDVTSTLSAFNDLVFNLDDIETGIVDNLLDVSIRLSVTTDEADAGFRSLFLLANSPLAPLDADYNNDGVVDAADYAAWAKGMSPFPNSRSDYNLWQAQFGETIGPGAGGGSGGDAISGGSVPEPSLLAHLVICGTIGMVARRRRWAIS
jgi:hypothetical protein